MLSAVVASRRSVEMELLAQVAGFVQVGGQALIED